MSRVSPCFKRIFVFFNALFAILGLVILILGLAAHFSLDEEREGKLTGVIVLVLFGSLSFIISVLGAYGAQKENKNILIAFFVITCLVTIGLFRMGVLMAISREEVLSTFKTNLENLSLDHLKPDLKNVFEYLQEQANCCGLFTGYQDWGRDVPASCYCADAELDQCQRMTKRTFYIYEDNRRVHSQPCGPLILEYVNKIMNITLGLFFGFGTLALLAAVMSLGMIIRITASTLTSPVSVFSLDNKPPKYSELVPSA